MATSSPSAVPRAQGAGYWEASKQPLTILAFLLPPIIAYEVGLALLLRSQDGILTNKAHETLLRFFDTFGLTATGGLYLGGAVIVVVLLVWQTLTRQPWRVDPSLPPLMAVESLGLTVPLIGLGVIIGGASASAPPVDLGAMSIWSRLTISIGAGLYEELLFRMMLIAVLHTLLVDVGKISPITGGAIAVVASAVAFTAYHPLRDAAGSVSGRRVTFYFLAGLYFGAVYLARGFGIVVGAHALYDVIVVSLLDGPGDA